MEYLYGSDREKPRKKINRQDYKEVPIVLDKNSQIRRQIAKKRIELLERRSKRYERELQRTAVPTQRSFILAYNRRYSFSFRPMKTRQFHYGRRGR